MRLRRGGIPACDPPSPPGPCSAWRPPPPPPPLSGGPYDAGCVAVQNLGLPYLEGAAQDTTGAGGGGVKGIRGPHPKPNKN